jgi:transcriptional repressor of dcmA and dcmR
MTQENLLGTKEAADLLGVSEASVRRWSDRGLLPVRRVGLRRERRFSEGDVRAFRWSGEPPGSISPIRPAESVSIGGVPLRAGSHLATFYDSDVGRVRLSLPFLVDGLRAGQPCFLLAETPVSDRYRDALAEAGLLDPSLASGLLTTARVPGRTVSKALDFWEAALWQAVGRGGGPIRIVGEMVSMRSLFASEGEMLRFEVEVDVLLRRFPVIALCQYDVRELSGEAMLAALKAHPDILRQPFGSFLP